MYYLVVHNNIWFEIDSFEVMVCLGAHFSLVRFGPNFEIQILGTDNKIFTFL